MPGYAGAIGRAPAVAAPGQRVPPKERFARIPLSQANTTITGVTRNASTLAAIGGCNVYLFLTVGERFVAQTVSDGSGNYHFDNPGSGPFFIVAYLPGSPDQVGTTVNTLIAS